MTSKKLLSFATIMVLFFSCSSSKKTSKDFGWVSIFDGKTLNDWKVGENASTFSIENGMIKVNGPVAHLFYVGPYQGHNFKNFEFKADVLTLPNSNSGMYFHTEYQESGWPEKGFEVQVNNSHGDWKRTGSLYNILDIKENHAKDNEWFTQHITVKDKRITVRVNGKTVLDYTEPNSFVPVEGHSGRKIGSGTFALQGHDPESTVFYKNIYVKPLP